eukprot:1766395-Rhodomonas_salina.3
MAMWAVPDGRTEGGGLAAEKKGQWRGHEGGVSCMTVVEELLYLVSGSEDCSVAVWSLDTSSSSSSSSSNSEHQGRETPASSAGGSWAEGRERGAGRPSWVPRLVR